MMDESVSFGTFPLPRNAGPASLRLEKGMFVMDMKGGFEEMGRQHGELVRGIVDDYVMNYYRDFIEKAVAHSPVSDISRSIPPRVARLLYYIFHKANKKTIGDEILQLQKGFTDALGIPNRDGERVILFADILHFLAGKAMAPMAMPGCSGFFARGAATQGGKALLGRNFDFYGRGLWDVYQSIKVFHPAGSQSFLWIGALGIPVGGFAMNESGLCVMPFTNFMKDVGIKGRPLFTIIGQILQRATCLDEAVKVMESDRRIGGLSLLIVDTRAKDACVCGFTSNHMEIIRMENDFIVRTNNHVTEEMKKIQVAPTAWWRHSSARYMRLNELIKERYGRITKSDAVEFMSDCIDPRERRKRIVGDIVAAVNNAMSVVVASDDDTIYIANGRFPVCHADTFAGFKLSALFSGASDIASDDLPGGRKLTPTEKIALWHYEEASTEYMDRFDPSRAVYHLRRAAEVVPDEPIFDRLAGLFLMKMGRPQDALPHMHKNADYKYEDTRNRAESLLWLARCLDLAGKREQAVQTYKLSADAGDPEITKAAQSGVAGPFNLKHAKHIDIEFIIGNPIAKYA